jgi:hypothetical protein
MRILLIGALTLATAGAATAAQHYDGIYQIGQCDASNWETRITIASDTVTYYESTCEMTNGVAIRDMEEAFLFDAVCSGEGQTWTERVFMQATAQGDVIQVRRGFALTYVPW